MSKLPCKLIEKKQIRILAVLGWMIYFSSYITRINFSAILVEFIQAEGVTKSAASAVTTALLVTYGVGQLISGYLGDRVSPRLLIFSGLVVASVCNVLLPIVSPSIGAMAVIWGINGIAQAMMWPPLVKICANSLNPEDYNRLIPVIGTSTAVATIAVYSASPLIITLSGWKPVFYVAAVVATLAAFIWFAATGKLLKNISFVSSKAEQKAERINKAANKVIWKLLPIILLAIAMQGTLRDGISIWMPTFLSETFKVESTVSILSTLAMPFTHMLIGLSTYRVLLAVKKDVFAAISVYFGIAAGFLLLLWCIGTDSMMLATICIAIGGGAIHGVNSLQTFYLPELLGGAGKISFYAGLINSAVYVGSAISASLAAVISDAYGWGATIVSWVLFAAVGLALTIVCMFIAKKKGNAGTV